MVTGKRLHGVAVFVVAMLSRLCTLAVASVESHGTLVGRDGGCRSDGGVAHSGEAGGVSDVLVGQTSVIDWVHFVTQGTRHSLLMLILAHPGRAPSVDELLYMYPERGRTSIVEQLEKLASRGVIEKLVIPKGERRRSLPHVFYTLSDPGYEFLDRCNLIPVDEEELRRRYSTMAKPDEIQRCENAPRDKAVVQTEDVDEESVAELESVVERLRQVQSPDSLVGRGVSKLREALKSSDSELVSELCDYEVRPETQSPSSGEGGRSQYGSPRGQEDSREKPRP